MTLEIANAAGETVRTLEGGGDTGLNRVTWDLREEQSTEIRMRTAPAFADWVPLDDDRTRDSPIGRISILAPPGEYTVTLKAGDVEASQPLTVLKDPKSEGTPEDIAEQTAMLREIKSDIERVAGMVNEVEWLRRQLADVTALTEETGQAEAVASVVDGLEGSLIAVEERLLQMKETGTGQDVIRWPSMVGQRLVYLAGAVASADFRPTDQMREVHAALRERLAAIESDYREVTDSQLPEANRALEAEGVPGLVRVPGPGER